MEDFIRERNMGIIKVKEEVSKKIKEETRKLKDKIIKTNRRIKENINSSKKMKKVKRKIEFISRKDEEPLFLKTLDKISFCYGILSLFVTFGLLFYPDVKVFTTWVLAKNAALIFIRFVRYRLKNWHYFFFDYCYFVNFALWVYLLAFPGSQRFFITVFQNTMCPLLNYFLIFRSKLIFHKLENVTSFLMHFTPSMVSMVLRFFNRDGAAGFPLPEEWDTYARGCGFAGLVEIFCLGFGFYTAWCLFYYVMIFRVLEKRIVKKGYLTLYDYATKDEKSFNEIIFRFGEERGPLCYMGLHWLIGLVGNLLSILLFFNRALTVAAVVFYALLPVWFCSDYYFDHFSRDYTQSLEKRALVNKEERRKRKLSYSAKSTSSDDEPETRSLHGHVGDSTTAN